MTSVFSTPARRRCRARQSGRELEHLQTQIGEWIEIRRKADPQQKHHTQLATLKEILMAPLASLRAMVDKLSAGAPGDIYATCRAIDLRAAWVRRIWLYYREKFDQRNDPALRPTLDAADEILWSCYAPGFLNGGKKVPAAPLIYIEPLFSPQAIPRDDPPPGLRSSLLGPFQKQFLAELPVPLIGLPPACIRAPWLLALLAHEAGHHIQHDVAPNRALIDQFSSLVGQAAESVAPDRARKWMDRSQEVFADAFSVACTGSAAIHVLTEMEEVSEAEMLSDDKPAYPSPLARLTLLAAIAARLPSKPSDAEALAGELTRQTLEAAKTSSSAAHRDAANSDVATAPTVAAAVLNRPLVETKTLPDLAAPAPAKQFPVEMWAHYLTAPNGPLIRPPADVRSARVLISSAVIAWLKSVEQPELDAEVALDRLRSRLFPAIETGRPPGTRAGAQPAAAASFAVNLTTALMEMPADSLQP